MTIRKFTSQVYIIDTTKTNISTVFLYSEIGYFNFASLRFTVVYGGENVSHVSRKSTETAIGSVSLCNVRLLFHISFDKECRAIHRKRFFSKLFRINIIIPCSLHKRNKMSCACFQSHCLLIKFLINQILPSS